MALEIAESAVVGDDLEAVGQRLEAASGPVAPALALGNQVTDERRALRRRQTGDRRERLLLAGSGGLVQERGEQLLLAAVRPEQTHRRGSGLVASGPVEPEPRGRDGGRLVPLTQELDPAAAPVRTRHAGYEAWHHRLQPLEQHLAVGTRLGQRLREQVEDELLVRLTGRVDPDVRERRRREDAADEVERLRLDARRC